MAFRVLGQVLEAGDPKRARIEVAIATSTHSDSAPTVYITKYQAGQVGERSIGMSLTAAADLAALLCKLASNC
jgi:hypothetical protein